MFSGSQRVLDWRIIAKNRGKINQSFLKEKIQYGGAVKNAALSGKLVT
jgi:hypothetical protein